MHIPARYIQSKAMDAKTVNKAINLIIRPILQQNGFEKFSGRTYWRHHSDRIDILNFQSFSSYKDK